MTIDWSSFTPGSALLGGALIGLSVAAFVLLNGRVAGITGLLATVFQRQDEGRSDKLLFLVGMVVAPIVWQLFQELPRVQFVAGGWLPLVVAGLLVGFGTRYGSGCTSGHGVCGLSRLSPRSLIATLSFMATGFITVYVLRHLIGV
ncbi:MAG TPA: YeeE/YedE family protein [Gammaproteobacteria bacterium]|nr:YeeE/YedE family protein [Gammaproteobacteria bacterium]